MKRKVIQLSPSTSVVSLPSKWVRSNKIRKGQAVEVEVIENKVIVSSDPDRSINEVTIDLSKARDRLFWAYLDAVYAAGYDVIHVLTSGAEQGSMMQKMVMYFPGLVVIDMRTARVTLKDIGGSKGELRKHVNRVFSMIIAMLEDALAALKKGDYQALSAMKKRDYHINSHISYCQRQLSKYGFEPMRKAGAMHTYIKMLEMLSDSICCYLEDPKEVKAKTLDSVKEACSLMQSLFTRFRTDKLLEYDKVRLRLKKSGEIYDLLFALEESLLQLQV